MAGTQLKKEDQPDDAAPRRGRPISGEKQQAMREAAIAEFAQLGFDGASVDAIAERAGVSKRTLYNHFPSKDVLFQSLVSEVGRRISVSTTIRYSPRTSLRAQILRFVREVRELVSEPATLRLVRTVVAEHIRHPDRVEPILQQYWKREHGFTEWARAACDDGRLRGDPQRIGHALASIMRAHVFWPTLLGRLDPQGAGFEAGIAEAIAMFLQFYATR